MRTADLRIPGKRSEFVRGLWFILMCSVIQCGVDVRTVQEIAGHASVKTTQRYLHSNDKIQQAAVEKLSEFGRYMPTTSKEELENIPATATIQ